ncbi:hypothetical protein COV11_04570 [Candidatus Woesearchaeota archaeon CG10_big_fil_rev_8_21_14_0_10_30_7]|nr:MAG: hypothetical protein COV11_04570 [Candidatus Woesearchaeota archaeon CG10_big_fil_rev_8_21_14_0_10_30_7]
MQLSVKNVDGETFKEFKAEAVKEGLKLGKALELAMKYYMGRRKVLPKLRFLDLKPIDWGKGTEKTSEEIDDIIYG